jgi:hypothetical protein
MRIRSVCALVVIVVKLNPPGTARPIGLLAAGT